MTESSVSIIWKRKPDVKWSLILKMIQYQSFTANALPGTNHHKLKNDVFEKRKMSKKKKYIKKKNGKIIKKKTIIKKN